MAGIATAINAGITATGINAAGTTAINIATVGIKRKAASARTAQIAPMLWRSTKKRRDHPEGFVAPCVPTVAAKPPAGTLWIHEIKQDGYRMLAKRGEGVRLLTRNGHD